MLIVYFQFLFYLCEFFIEKVSARGNLLYVKTICKNKHVFERKSQPKLKNISIGNILLSSSVLYSGNTFGQIYEMFKMINIACISKARFFEIQKTLLFPVVNRFYEVLLKKMINLNIPITSLTTDRQIQIRAFMKKECSFISHQFSKPIKKKLFKHAKSSSKKSLNDQSSLVVLFKLGC